ncbi:MAG TPA: LysM peptidoglycan-binding domain-containing protein [Bryobacteraceae bacterium]|jgi:nucleoid-associated protein YgaU
MELDDYKLKYQSVLNEVTAKGVSLSHLHVQDGKLFMQGTAPSEEIKNDIWNAIKACDPNWESNLTCDLSVDPSLPQPQKTYTVVAGDSLWRIAQHELGNGAEFPKLIAANPGKLKDQNSVIHPGDVLVIPS